MPELFHDFITLFNDNESGEIRTLLRRYTLDDIVDSPGKEETFDLSFYHAYKQNDEVYSLVLQYSFYSFYSKVAAEECLKLACEKNDRDMIDIVMSSTWIEMDEFLAICIGKCNIETAEWVTNTYAYL